MPATVPDLPKTTPLTARQTAMGARMVTFAGYSMPLHFREGILKEHLWTRAHASVFDVSHMGPAFLSLERASGDGDADHERIAALIEPLVCGDIRRLKPGQLRYTLLLNEDGGILDDLIIGRPAEAEAQGSLYLVVNAGTKEADFLAVANATSGQAKLHRARADQSLIAVQGPEAEAVVETIIPGAAELSFMSFRTLLHENDDVVVSRSGYTGEDGFEILDAPGDRPHLYDLLLADSRVGPAGLGARDSLRLEAGLPLYGHDLDATTSPIEANLAFAVSKRRLKAQDVRGATRITREAATAPRRVRIGLDVLEGPPAREGAVILDPAGQEVGVVTSGGFSPSLSRPIAMGYVPPRLAGVGAPLAVVVRGKTQPARTAAMPFLPHRYRRQAKEGT